MGVCGDCASLSCSDWTCATRNAFCHKGASPAPDYRHAIDANHNGLDVNIVGGAGGGGGGTQYTEDVASAGGESLTLSGAVRRDTAASSATTDGDYATINTDATGRLWTNTELPDAAAASDLVRQPDCTLRYCDADVLRGRPGYGNRE